MLATAVIYLALTPRLPRLARAPHHPRSGLARAVAEQLDADDPVYRDELWLYQDDVRYGGSYLLVPARRAGRVPVLAAMALLIHALFAASQALAPRASPSLCSRRALLLCGGAGCSAIMPLPSWAGAAAGADECLSCKLKSTIAESTGAPAIGTDIGDLLSPRPQLAVKEVIDVGTDPLAFEATMRRTLKLYDPEKYRVLVWVQSELINGVPWCGDTRAAIPLLESALYRAKGKPIVLVTADVVRSDYYLESYLYRQDQQLKLTGVPTLYRWGRDGPVMRIQERQITPSALDALIR